MSLRQLSLTDFRNLQSCTLDFNPRLNLICGANASGKTSLLESLHIICQGRSFRSSRLDECIQHNTDGFLLFGKFVNFKAGLSRNNSETRIKINGEHVNRLSTLAEISPVKIINPESFQLVTGSPGLKREYIDWCLFHVEHQYHKGWMEFNHALKQRNALLRNKHNLEQLDYWDDYICKSSSKISQLRKECTQSIRSILDNDLLHLIKDLDVLVEYQPGWNVATSLDQIYKKNRDRDIKYGFTQYGIHRDNLEIKSNHYTIKQELSRGQQKRLSIAMILAQIVLVRNKTNKKIILLLDDIQSELDEVSVKLVLDTINQLDLQLFITYINEDKTLMSYCQEYKLFHVEHGMIRSVKNT